jgi:hypothetical protein
LARDPLPQTFPYVLRAELAAGAPCTLQVGTAVNMNSSTGRIQTDFGGGAGTYVDVVVPFGIQDRAPAPGDIVFCLAFNDNLLCIGSSKPAS